MAKKRPVASLEELMANSRLYRFRRAVRFIPRLQAHAEAGQLIVSEEVYRAVCERFPEAGHRELALKGKSAPVAAHAIDVRP